MNPGPSRDPTASTNKRETLGLWPARTCVCACSVALALGLTVVARAAERKVLGELFLRSDYCSDCESAATVVSDMIDQYPDALAVVEYHVLDPYATPFGDGRAAFYDIWSTGSVPWFDLDGLGDAWPIEDYESTFQARVLAPTWVTLSVGAEPVSGETLRITARACNEPDGGSLDLRLYLVVAEDHYPDAPEDSRNTCRVGFAPETMALAADSCHAFSRDVSLDPWWTQSELKIIAWAQNQAASGPAEVHQAAEQGWPFEPLPAHGDWDNDGDADLDDFAEFHTCLSGPGAVPPPSPRCLDTFDVDQDADVDVKDFAAVQGQLSASSP
jgi:hypothetical protein